MCLQDVERLYLVLVVLPSLISGGIILLIYIFKINTLVLFPIEKKNNVHSNHFKKKKSIYRDRF